jgi:hypothetical protein
MLSMPILNGRIGKWILALSEFELKFESAKAIKGSYLTIQLLKITRGWEAEGLEEEAKVCFIHFSCFASSAPPSSTVPGLP